MPFSSSSDEDDGFLRTKKLGQLQAKFCNIYQAKKLVQSDDEDNQPLSNIFKLNKSPVSKSVANSTKTKSPVSSTKPSSKNKYTADTETESFTVSSDEEVGIRNSEGTEKSEIIELDENTSSQNKLVDADDFLKKLDQLAKTAKEMCDDYDAAILGKGLMKRAPFKGKKRPRTERNSARLARLQIQLQIQEETVNQSVSISQINKLDTDISKNNATDIISLVDSEDSDHGSPKRLKHIENPNLNPPVLININWRCDSEITHLITVFKFQCLSCIVEFCCNNYKTDPKLILFTINDKPVDLKEHCYASLRLTESSVIDGGVLPESYLQIERPKVHKKSGLMRLRVQYMVNSKTKDFAVHVKKNDNFEDIFWLIIKELNCDFESITLHCDGLPIKIDDKIDELDLEEDDCIDLTLTTSPHTKTESQIYFKY